MYNTHDTSIIQLGIIRLSSRPSTSFLTFLDPFRVLSIEDSVLYQPGPAKKKGQTSIRAVLAGRTLKNAVLGSRIPYFFCT
jgi:hypothetical protein